MQQTLNIAKNQTPNLTAYPCFSNYLPPQSQLIKITSSAQGHPSIQEQRADILWIHPDFHCQHLQQSSFKNAFPQNQQRPAQILLTLLLSLHKPTQVSPALGSEGWQVLAVPANLWILALQQTSKNTFRQLWSRGIDDTPPAALLCISRGALANTEIKLSKAPFQQAQPIPPTYSSEFSW